MKKITKILIYTDKGAGSSSSRQLINCFKSIYDGNLEINQVNSNYILSGQLNEQNDSKSILCFGGGYDLGYLELLGEKGCEEIRKYVHSGGFYLGICAGAYFASDYIEFNLNGPLEVKGERFLKFFKGKAIGPLNNFQYSDFDDSAIAAKIKITTNGLIFYNYLNGGCFFEPHSNYLDSFRVIATYENNPNNQDKIAIIECDYGQGKCLLSGVHFEFDADHLNIRDKTYSQLLIHKLTVVNKESADLLKDNTAPSATSDTHSNYNLVRYLFRKSFNL